jgi:uncharacterized membrane protein YhfC
MAAVALASIALPSIACLVVRTITKARFVSLFVGMAVFFVCFIIAVATQALFSFFIGSQVALVIIGATRAGVIEELGRFLAFKVFLRRKKAVGDALMYGVGHGGMEVVLTLTLGMVSNIILALAANAGILDSLIASMPEEGSVLRQAISTLANASPLLLSLGLFERVSAIILHIALSVVVFCAARQRKPQYLLLAILLHTLANSSILLLVEGWVEIELFELIFFVVAAAYALIAWKFARNYIKHRDSTDKNTSKVSGG